VVAWYTYEIELATFGDAALGRFQADARAFGYFARQAPS